MMTRITSNEIEKILEIERKRDRGENWIYSTPDAWRMARIIKKLWEENERFMIALEEIAESHDGPENDQIANDALNSITIKTR